jgi:hypothetical protein
VKGIELTWIMVVIESRTMNMMTNRCLTGETWRFSSFRLMACLRARYSAAAKKTGACIAIGLEISEQACVWNLMSYEQRQ